MSTLRHPNRGLMREQALLLEPGDAWAKASLAAKGAARRLGLDPNRLDGPSFRDQVAAMPPSDGRLVGTP
jgi:hypothetical protein